MKPTIFSWGYYGWGNHTPDLIEAVDAVEQSRGFEPPIFVDIRIRRSVRAVGFNGTSFEKILGAKRHIWMKSLGNKRIVSGEGPAIQIAEPEKAEDLLHLAESYAKKNTRLIYFCGCQWARCDGNINCHRASVTQLLLERAKTEKHSVQLVEWPGGQSKHVQLDVTPEVFRAVRKGGRSILLGSKADAEMLGLPACSVITLRSNGESLHRIVGPAMRYKERWGLPVLWQSLNPETGLSEYTNQAEKLRREWGLEQVET